MAETVGSSLCERGRHFDCLGCAGCTCHPRLGKPAPVWEAEPVQTACRGVRVRPETPAPY